MGFNYRTGWIFFPKIINARYLISMSRLDFEPKNNKCTLCYYSIVQSNIGRILFCLLCLYAFDSRVQTDFRWIGQIITVQKPARQLRCLKSKGEQRRRSFCGFGILLKVIMFVKKIEQNCKNNFLKVVYYSRFLCEKRILQKQCC